MDVERTSLGPSSPRGHWWTITALLLSTLLHACSSNSSTRDAGNAQLHDAQFFFTDASDARGDLLPDAAIVRNDASDGGSQKLLLIDHKSWRRYPADLDPLPSHQPVELSCRESATFVELDSFEVDTTRCNYVLSEHPSLLARPVGSRMRVTLLHYDLSAPQPAQGHVALLFGDSLQWEVFIPIPSPADVIEAVFVSSKEIAVGEPIRLHLHNHGGNAWLLISLEALSDSDL